MLTITSDPEGSPVVSELKLSSKLAPFPLPPEVNTWPAVPTPLLAERSPPTVKVPAEYIIPSDLKPPVPTRRSTRVDEAIFTPTEPL